MQVENLWTFPLAEPPVPPKFLWVMLITWLLPTTWPLLAQKQLHPQSHRFNE